MLYLTSRVPFCQTFHVPDPHHIHLITPVVLCEEDTQYAFLFSSPNLPLSPTYHPQHCILKHPQPMFFPKYDQPCFPPIYNRHSIVRNDIPLWYMMISHTSTLISVFCLLQVLAVVKSKQSLYSAVLKISLRIFQFPNDSFPQNPKHVARNKLI